IVERPRLPEAPYDGGTLALGEMVADVSFFVPLAALHRRLAEDAADRLAQRLRSIDHEEDALFGIEAALDKVGEQRGRDGRVLGRALPEPERDLDAVGGDSERNHVRALLEIEPVDHHRRQPDVVEAAAHQLAERAARSFDEGARHRRARRRPRRLLDLGTDRLLHAPVAARRDAGKHPLQHRARQRITIAEVLVRPQPYLRAAVGAARPWPLDRDAATAECHLAALMAVPYSSALPVVLPFRPDDLVDFFLHQLGEHAEPDTDAQREQPFLGRADQLAERFLHPRRTPQLLSSDLPQRYRLHGGSSSCRLTTSASPRSRSDRTRWRTATSKFYDERDNLDGTVSTCHRRPGATRIGRLSRVSRVRVSTCHPGRGPGTPAPPERRSPCRLRLRRWARPGAKIGPAALGGGPL